MNGYIGRIPLSLTYKWLKLSMPASYVPGYGYGMSLGYFGAFIGSSKANLLWGAVVYSESNFDGTKNPPRKATEENPVEYWACAYSDVAKTTWIAFKRSDFSFDRIKIKAFPDTPILNATLYGSNNSTNGSDGDWVELITHIYSDGSYQDCFYNPGGILSCSKETNATYADSISNPSFERITSNVPDGWTLSQSAITAGNYYAPNTTWKTYGDKSFYMEVGYGKSWGSTYYVQIGQRINFSNSTIFTFDAKTGAFNGACNGVSELLIGGVRKWSSTIASTEYLNQEIDVSSITGNQDVVFRVIVGGVTSGDKYAQLYIDNVRMNNNRGNRGKVISLEDHYFSRRYP